MPPHPCIIPGCRHLAVGKPRCPIHEREHQARRNAERTHYTGPWQRIAKRFVDAHIAEFGHWCPGWGVPPHPSTDLCCDHVQARDASRLAVLCRPCNSRKSVAERH